MPYYLSANTLPNYTLIVVTSTALRRYPYENNTGNVKITPGILSLQENKRNPLNENISQNKINQAALTFLHS